MRSPRQRKITTVVSEEENARINEWRRQQADLPGLAEAVRRLISRGIDGDQAEARK